MLAPPIKPGPVRSGMPHLRTTGSDRRCRPGGATGRCARPASPRHDGRERPRRPRNALLRLPTTVLVLASLGFLGLGEQPPTAEWGRLLPENQPYAELAPWTVLAPAAALVLLSVLAVTGSALRAPGRRKGARPAGQGASSTP
ncbi:hypothetical protein SUDANB108_00636 [Streptomyces sp. enrichment culture]